MDHDRKAELVPIDKKCVLNIQEAMLYSGMTQEELMELTTIDELDVVLRVGHNRYFKRTKLEEYLDNKKLEELKHQQV